MFSVGEQFLTRPDPDNPLPRILRVTKVVNSAADAEINCRAILHEDARGTLYEPGKTYEAWESDLAFRVAEGEPVAPHVVMATRMEERGTNGVAWHKVGKGSVHAVGDGGPRCGATLQRTVHKPERWDDWNNRRMPPRDETSVWLPTFRAVTCKRCLAKGA